MLTTSTNIMLNAKRNSNIKHHHNKFFDVSRITGTFISVKHYRKRFSSYTFVYETGKKKHQKEEENIDGAAPIFPAKKKTILSTVMRHILYNLFYPKLCQDTRMGEILTFCEYNLRFRETVLDLTVLLECCVFCSPNDGFIVSLLIYEYFVFVLVQKKKK